MNQTESMAKKGPVRVAFMIDSLTVGGTETQLLTLIRELDRARVQPQLILLDGSVSTVSSLLPENCPVIRLGVKRLLSLNAARRVIELARYLKREKIDVLQVYFPDSTCLGIVAGALARVPATIRTRNNDNYWMTPAHRVIGRLMNPLVTVTVCNTVAGRTAVLRDERCKPDDVMVIENGVDASRFAHIPPPTPAQMQKRWVGMVANLRPVKGVDVFVRAAALVVMQFPDVEFVVAGEGTDRRVLEQLINSLELSGRFHLLGHTTDIPGFLATLDVAVLSSHAEGMPNAVLEYMAAARPIVATRVGGVPSLIEHKETGLLVSANDHDQLAESICELLIQPDKACEYGTSARRRAIARFSRESVVERFTSTFEDLAAASRHVRN